MLNRKVFDDEIEKLIEVYEGFIMTKAKAVIWYEYSKDLTDKQWVFKISECIKNCRRTPTLADILDVKEYYKKPSDEGRTYETVSINDLKANGVNISGA